MNSIAGAEFIPNIVRIFFLRLAGVNVKKAKILSGSRFTGGNIEIGENTFINHDCMFENNAKIKIGKNCDIGMGTLFCTVTHNFGDFNRRAGDVIKGPIIVGSGAWLGARVTILPNVKIGSGCIIGAGALVTKNCEPNGLYTGVPARRVKELV